MSTIYEVMKNNHSKFEHLKSPMSKSWEIIVFKTLETLHALESEGYATTTPVKKLLLPMVASEVFDSNNLKLAIDKIEQMAQEENRESVKRHFEEVIDLLKAVQNSLS